jgi:hypothetical protein
MSSGQILDRAIFKHFIKAEFPAVAFKAIQTPGPGITTGWMPEKGRNVMKMHEIVQ